MGVDGAEGRFFGELCRTLKGAADPDSDHYRRTGIRACGTYGVEDELLYALGSVGGSEHFDRGHIFAAEALAARDDPDFVAAYDFGMDDSGSVVARVNAVKNGIAHHAFAEVSLVVRLAHALLNGFLKAAVFNAYLVAVLHKEHRHSGVLTERDLLGGGDLIVFDDLAQHAFCDGRILNFKRLFKLPENISAYKIVAVHKQFFYRRGDPCCVNRSKVHKYYPFSVVNAAFCRYVFHYKTFLKVFQYFLFCDTIMVKFEI